jgi:beta-ketodecanoyl-[acyl-carrier-protein] synthase
MNQQAPRAIIAATGLYTPPHKITNEELVESFNAWVDRYNEENGEAIEAGTLEAKQHSSVAFVEKASGIKARYVVDKEGILDTSIMTPAIAPRPNEELSVLAEMGVAASQDALKNAGKTAADVDAVIVAGSTTQRSYPAVAIEIQQALGVNGWGFDMNVACSSATFGIQAAADMIAAGHARAILVVSPEVCSSHLNWRDRDSHFIFGDVATAILLESSDTANDGGWEILGTRLKTQFSNNIRNNNGYLSRCEDAAGAAVEHGITHVDTDRLFKQEGRRVFKDVVPMVSAMIEDHMGDLGIEQDGLKRMWLHQANIHMNDYIGRKVLGREPEQTESPTILDEYANTSSAGSIIAFHKNNADFAPGDIGLICSFGAGYSAGTVFVRKRG